ncbi:MAG: hypothetical protein DCC88_10660 [Spirobacillus cienkowskii]|jgi:hypothetical protein|uniref:Transposase putative helix-turn-helix domain-containing protein n=1 Tax=Spirobacillus cienkowskii TaxID=495820 RepID=A0A369KL35_9BACT|nr:MAG: hypothetical protein DCC88_10660 [Spirobacillus cienkowskii]
MTICGVKFRTFPSIEQAKKLSQWIDCARVIYICKVSNNNQNYNGFKNTGENFSLNQDFSPFKKKEKEWLNQFPSQILRYASLTWYTAKKRFFKGLANNLCKNIINNLSFSFCYDLENIVKSEEDLLDEYSCFEKDSLNVLTVDFDRGVVIPFQTSRQISYDFRAIYFANTRYFVS